MWFKKKEKKKSPEQFSQKWIDDWKESINRNDDFRKKGKNWNATILLRFDPVPASLDKKNSTGFFLDLSYGACNELKYASNADMAKSDIVLTADVKTWRTLIANKKDPTLMIMKGGLKLEKGSLVMLSIQRHAAKSLLMCAPVYSDTESHTIPAKHTKDESEGPGFNHQKPFVSTKKGLDFESFPMKLFQKSKELGTWDPAGIDFREDRNQWGKLSHQEQKIIIHLSVLFIAGEASVTLDLLPLIQVIAREGRVEEEIYLKSFLWEEAKHTEMFSRFNNQVIMKRPDFESFHGPFYQNLFYRKLPESLNRLNTDPSPHAQLNAAGTYKLIVEGMLAETASAAYHKILNENDILPGLQRATTLLKQDQSRHIAYGMFHINRLLEENPDQKESFENILKELLNDATNVIHELFVPYHHVSLGLEKEWFLEYAINQFQSKVMKLNLNV